MSVPDSPTSVDISIALRNAVAAMPPARLSMDDAVTSRITVTDPASGPAGQLNPASATGGTAERIRYLSALIRTGRPGVVGGAVPVVVATSPPHPDQQEDNAVPTASESAVADSYLIAMPPGWVEQPVDAASFERTLAEQLSELRSSGVDRLAARRFEMLQRQIYQQMLSGNVRYVATLASSIGDGPEPEGDEGSADSGVDLLLAGAVVTARARADLAAPGPITASMLLQGFRGAVDDAGEVSLEEPRVVDLPAGPALRLVRFHSESLPSDASLEQIEYYEHSYLVPHDGGERVGFLQFITPSLGYCEPLGELFDAIAGTFRVLYEGDPTDFGPSESAVPDAE